MMKKIFLFIFFACVLASSVAALPPGPKDIGKSKVYISQNWSFDFGPTLPSSFSFKTFGFPTSPAQRARMEATGYSFSEQRDSLGNMLLDFSFSPKYRNEKILLRAYIDTDYSVPQLGSDASTFLQGSSLSQASAEITSKARELTASTPTQIEKFVLLTGWVHNRVKYDGAGYGNTILNATWVFENKLGTCDEYSHLLIAMLRAVDIPAKFDAGFVCSANCTESSNWGLHAWVEAFVDGKWVPADPTFNEAVLLDATHIKFAEGNDQENIKERLSATGFGYPIGDVKVNREIFVSLDEWQGFNGVVALSLQVPQTQVGEKSIETVTATIENKAGQAIAVPLSLSVPGEMQVRGESEVLLYMPAGSKSNYSWNIVFPGEFKEGYTYNFTLEVSSLGVNARNSIIAKKGGDTRSVEALRVKEITPTLSNDSVKLLVEVENSGNTRAQNALVRVTAGSYNFTQSLSLEAGEARQLEFYLPAAPEATSVSGAITILLEGKQVSQQFNIALQIGQALAAQDGEENGTLVPPEISTEIMVLMGAIAIVLILALALMMLRKN